MSLLRRDHGEEMLAERPFVLNTTERSAGLFNALYCVSLIQRGLTI